MRIAFVFMWLAVLFCLCLLPWEMKAHLHSMGRYHPLFHLVAFAATSILVVGSARSLVSRILTSLLSVGIAFTTELLEQWRFHNPFEWVDIQSDCEGIILGIAILTVMYALTRRFTSQRA